MVFWHFCGYISITLFTKVGQNCLNFHNSKAIFRGQIETERPSFNDTWPQRETIATLWAGQMCVCKNALCSDSNNRVATNGY